MSEQFMGELRLLPYTFAPSQWALCNGQTMSVNQNQALYSLLGTTYGGDGVNTFMLPDLRGGIPIGAGQGWPRGTVTGTESVTLSAQQTPRHTHMLMTDSQTAGASNLPNPANAGLGQSAGVANPGGPFDMAVYGTSAPAVQLASQTIGYTGGQPHENRQPFLALNYCIAIQGLYPSRG